MADYNYLITYRKGSENIAADALTRKQEEYRTQKDKDLAGRQHQLIPTEQICALTRASARATQGSISHQVLSESNEDDFVDAPDTQLTSAERAVSIERLASPVDSVLQADKPNAATEREPVYQLVDDILAANRAALTVRQAVEGKERWRVKNGLLVHDDRLYVDNSTPDLRTKLIAAHHDPPTHAHPGRTKTLSALQKQYYWPSMRSDVERYVKNCSTCRRTHVSRDRPPGLLQPLPIPDRCWQHVSFDFKSFPKDRHGYDNVFVVVDRLGKRAFSIPCNKTVTAAEAARLYYTYIWRIYGTPETATSDRGPQFVSDFMNELCKLTRVKQKLSSAWHPQTDGNTEILNQYN